MRDLTSLVAALAGVVKDERGTGEYRRRVRLRSLQLLDAMGALWGGLPPARHIVAARTACFRLSALLEALRRLDLVVEEQLVTARTLLRRTADELQSVAAAVDAVKVPTPRAETAADDLVAVGSSPAVTAEPAVEAPVDERDGIADGVHTEPAFAELPSSSAGSRDEGRKRAETRRRGANGH